MTRSSLICLFATASALFLARDPLARSATGTATLTPRIERRSPVSLDQYRDPGELNGALFAGSAADTTWLGSWRFENGPVCIDESWTSVDRWEQVGTFFHVDDFSGLGGGTFGRLTPIEGAQSLWCGARPGASGTLCSYATLPGYGNDWRQIFMTTSCLTVSGDVSVDYLASWDTEPGYDFVHVEFDTCGIGWFELARHTGIGSGFKRHTIPAASHSGGVHVRFRVSSDHLWSDQDGLWNTDGAVLIDELIIRDSGIVLLPMETFELESPGDTVTLSGNWAASPGVPYGDFAGLFSGTTVLQEDRCQTNASCLWAFIDGSVFDYACGGAPLQAAVPYQNVEGQGIYNEIWSPVVTLTGTGAEFQLRFDVYRDLPLDALIGYRWSVRSVVGGCYGRWRSRATVFFGSEKDWFRSVQSIGDLIEPGATAIQIALSARDMCFAWCGIFGTGDCHSHAPLFDNVELVRIDTQGAQWSVRPVDLFQDTFASDGTLTGTARADAAVDRLPTNHPDIRPGDSVTVNVGDLVEGLADDPFTGFGAAVYGYVSVWPSGQPGKTGSALSDDSFRWPVVDSLVHNGNMWYCIRMDSSFSGVGRSGPVQDQFCLDLDDDLFTPGDTISFFFAAKSNGAAPASYWSEFTGATSSMVDVLEKPMEFTILPAAGWQRGGVTLYVDGYDGFGAQPFFDWAFSSIGFADQVDRYDIRAPDALSGNRPGARVVDVMQQLLGCYRVILWDVGDLDQGLIGDGTGLPEKSDDAGMLAMFLDQLPEDGGVYFSGDNIASELSLLGSASAVNLRSYISYTVTVPDHKSLGMMASPRIIGVPTRAFDHGVLGPDTAWVTGSCPDIGSFDVLNPVGPGMLQMLYSGGIQAAVVSQTTVNTSGKNVGVMMSGFSFHKIANDRPGNGMDRWDFMRDVYNWMGTILPVISGVPDAGAPYSLAQNYPNPFNPTTTIAFSLRERTHVQLRIYNVAGALVRTLVDEVRAAGAHTKDWDGRNAAGQRVASGVYFYRIAAKDFVRTKKMVLLK